nr:hypothetical protein [uncultured Mediterranean phage uvMED]
MAGRSSKSNNRGNNLFGFLTSGKGRQHHSASDAISVKTVASGGNINAAEPGNGYVYHVWTADGTFDIPAALSSSFEVLLIGGGGSGGVFGPPNGAGGGGAGGVVHHTQLSASGVLTITIGDGGGPVSASAKENGDNSTIVSPTGPWTLTALGGGAGGYYATAGNQGGSGGGGGGYGSNYGNAHAVGDQPTQNSAHPQQTGLNNYGNNGGAPSDPNPGNAGGGGGAGSVGGSHPEAEGAPTGSCGGGAGRAFPSFPGVLTGFDPLPSEWKTAVGPTGLFAGGGAGEKPYSGSGTAVAGPGGGGGYYPGPATYVANAVANTGGGGGALNSGGGGTGGKGICIIRYLVQ